ncbi:hypothetical protein GH714_004075 [Hevea brasiliensis]|uniref:START domain-containing protein n=1 Tax=Hevea brasiliensis TaxID=3981 RepID=A0A6A6KRY9_HEVBR|nr:hypothetical protein GH714_004075 [Hevea brasiliensis]
MDDTFFDLMEFWKKPSITEIFVDILLCAVPIWLAVMIGLVIGWSWRPGGLAWFSSAFAASSGSCGRRRRGLELDGFGWLLRLSRLSLLPHHLVQFQGSHGEPVEGEEIVTENDLEHLLLLLEGKDGQMEWQSMMERSTSNMSYQAWRLEPQTGPTVYRSRTVFEDATAELFPFFCSDREYIIGRRIWEAGKTYYCVTKGVPYPGLPKRDKPRRVEHYFSSWVIRAVESRKGDGQMSACEVILLHYEDMGIPKDVAKLGVRHGMWGTVKKLHSGMRAYQNSRKTEASLSRSALMARITTKISFDESTDSAEPVSREEDKGQVVDIKRHMDHGIDWKWIVIGGTVALVCGLHSGAIGKALLLGAGQRIARR